MTDKLREAAPLLPCPFCGDDGDKGTQAVTLMNAERTSFRRVSCRCCGATCPEPNWNHRAARAQQDAQKKRKPLFAEMIAQHPGLAEELAQQDAQNAADEVWRKLFWQAALKLKCLPSSYPDANGHVLRAIDRLMGSENAQQDAQAELPIIRQNKLLADALASCILASGIVRTDIDGLTGPQLLLFAEDLRTEIETLVRDAERYRWLRDDAWGGNNRSGPHLVAYRPGLMPSAVTELAEDAADTAIDAAMQEKQS